MAARKKTPAKRSAKLRRPNPVPRLNPKNGPPVYIDYEGGTIPVETIEAAVRSVLASRGKLSK